MVYPMIVAQAQANSEGALFGVGGVLMFLGALLAIVSLGLFLFAVADVSENRNLSGGRRVAWMLISALVVFIGPILYLTIGRKGARPKTTTEA